MNGREDFQDRELTCADCGRRFTWGAGEQAFYGERGFSEPKRCKDCRQAQKDRRGAATEKKGGER